MTDEQRFLQALASITRASGELVPVGLIRRKLPWNKAKFDRVAIAAYRNGSIALHYHDHPGSLSEEDKRRLVTDGKTYYVGAALRKSYTEDCGGSCMASKKKTKRKAKRRTKRKAKRKSAKKSTGYTTLAQVQNALKMRRIRTIGSLRNKVCR